MWIIYGTIFYIVFILPIFMLYLMVTSIAEWLMTHFYITFILYSIINAIICFFTTKSQEYQSKKKFVLCFTGKYIRNLSLIYMFLLYAIPCVILTENSFGGFVELVIVSFVWIFIWLGIICYEEKSPATEFLLGTLFFIATRILCLGVPIESLVQIYNVKAPILFRILFDFRIAPLCKFLHWMVVFLVDIMKW